MIKVIKERARQDAQYNKAPESPQELHLLFGREADAAGLSLLEVTTEYDREYSLAKQQEPIWRSLNLGWIAAIISILILIFQEVIKNAANKIIKAAATGSYNRLAGYKALRRTALACYRKALIRKYSQLKNPFRPDQPLDLHSIYVPLKVKGSSDSSQIEALRAAVEYQRLMVIGSPGSGKSTLLKHIALSYAEGRLSHFPEKPIPILIEINRLSIDKPLEESIAAILASNDFPKATTFVDLSLKRGMLMLLFDGLDEVSSVERPRLVNKIQDFLETYNSCRSIVTCRTAVYRNEFAEILDQTLEIVEFNDRQIRHFLGAWEHYMPPQKSIEQLISTLRERPRIMALARNPLLLTIIAYLYITPEFVLPHSRAEFYSQAVDFLLDWKKTYNRYKALHKRLVLQHLALYNQDVGSDGQQDRRSIELKTILAEIKRVLPELSLEDKEAGPLLDEIVERSGLLLSVSGGSLFQFAHLTLQEFFAANALRNDVDGLISRFRNDRDAWRETVKLWCGLDHDSTKMLQAIRDEDPITAFECLADAQKIHSTLADQIIDDFKSQLGPASETGDAVIQAFAAVASGQSLRSRDVFKFLSDVLDNATDHKQKKAAATSLSLTNHPQAVKVIAEHYAADSVVRPALVRMGDLAVSDLKALAKREHKVAINDLQAIGTPLAAEALCSMLWDDDKDLAAGAAWHLAILFSQSSIESQLRNYTLKQEQRTAPGLRRVWEPFGETPDSSLGIIAERITYLLVQASLDMLPAAKPTLDAKLIIPVCSKIAEENIQLANLDVEAISQELKQIIDTTPNILSSFSAKIKGLAGLKSKWKPEQALAVMEAIAYLPAVLNVRSRMVDECLKISSPRLRYFLACLPETVRDEWLFRLIRGPVPTFEDWVNLNNPVKYKFDTGLHYRTILISAALITVIAFYTAILIIWGSTTRLTWGNASIILIGCGVLITWALLREKISEQRFDPEAFVIMHVAAPLLFLAFFSPYYFVKFILSWMGYVGFIYYAGIVLSVLIAFSLIILFIKVIDNPPAKMYEEDIPGLITCLLIGACIFYVYYYFTHFLINTFSKSVAVLTWIVLCLLSLALWKLGKRRDRAARNPLSGILNLNVRQQRQYS